ncbi:SMP-30/gluconolactonase/LRE family protein [Yinghuangia seranimata]|uniref:SMP-30/gluconolactonase/LRE family protein n=1 Tax=Yinghuangia seranimata TaxID=408067 RepID=UPI00248C217E|nr:SMP-30/gluconolactonase/LRE family protein [Yinghuangia seranimata]MDI2124518.1 SMP-30/gluconolactonase/LRE family protein [Yinghuangia seranimata]
MRIWKLTTLVDGLCFAEGPRWHAGRLWFSDLVRHRVLAVDGLGAVEEVVPEHEDQLSGLGFLPDGDLLVVAMAGRRVLRRASDGTLSTHADLNAPELGRLHVNDMVVRADGFAYVGQMGYDYATHDTRPEPLPLLGVAPDGTVRAVAEDLHCANGMALSPDGTLLVVAESAAQRLTAFDVAADGSLSGRRVFAALGPRDHPDGICLDAEGAVWVACPVARRFVRVLPGGEVTDAIELGDERRAIACVLGGPERRTLFMVTAETLGDPDTSRALRAGRIETTEVAVAGAGTP